MNAPRVGEDMSDVEPSTLSGSAGFLRTNGPLDRCWPRRPRQYCSRRCAESPFHVVAFSDPDPVVNLSILSIRGRKVASPST